MNGSRPHHGAARLLSAALLTALLSGCGDSCESVADEIQAIGMEINRDGNPWDRAEELQALQQKMEQMGCLRAP